MSRDHTLPEFRNPPVNEVVVGVQFRRIAGLDVPSIVAHGDVRYGRGRWTQQGYAPGIIERFGMQRSPEPQFRFTLDQAPPRTRIVYLPDDAGTKAVQLQDTALIRNWRKLDGHRYPRFESIIAEYETDLRELADFVNERELGELRIIQGDVTYVNTIPPRPLSEIFAPWSGKTSDGWLGEADAVDITVSYNMCRGETIVGRLHANVSTNWSEEGEEIYLLTLTARGAPENDSIEAAIDFLRYGREHVVRGFASLTSSKMHEVWERSDVAAGG